MLIMPRHCERALRNFRTSGDYLRDVEEDFRQIAPFLPDNVRTIVDIGCGLAGIDVLLKRKVPEAKLGLVDDSLGPFYENFQTGKPPYGDRCATDAFLLANGVYDACWLDGRAFIAADLIISTLAWGFHFPLDTYKVDGFCIADLRKGKEGPRGKIISEGKSHYRCAFQCSK